MKRRVTRRIAKRIMRYVYGNDWLEHFYVGEGGIMYDLFPYLLELSEIYRPWTIPVMKSDDDD